MILTFKILCGLYLGNCKVYEVITWLVGGGVHPHVVTLLRPLTQAVPEFLLQTYLRCISPFTILYELLQLGYCVYFYLFGLAAILS